jgi:hypothetical protein
VRRIECEHHDKLFSPNGGSIKENGALDCEEITDRIIEEIGTQFLIAYSSERREGDTQFHPVRVFTTRRDLKVRTRKGVY